MKKHFITFLGHILLATLHYYLMSIKGANGFQFFSFIVVHYIWHSLIIDRIYGLK